MFDPAILGTVRIGLDSIQAEADAYDDPRRRPVRPRRERVGIRIMLVRGLRRTAALLERPTAARVPEAEGASR
jgi:hypothetical protein